MHIATRSVHSGVYKDTAYNSVATPIYPSSTFFFDGIGRTSGYDYTRTANPTRDALAENLAALEGGAGAQVTNTGMSAIATVMFLLRPGDHVIAGHDIYGGTYRQMDAIFRGMGIDFDFVDMGDPENVRSAVKPNTRCIWIETPSNPLLNIVDIAATVTVARDCGAITVADNTFLSPYLQQPMEMGVDIVIHSTTKYLNGHSDVVGGAIICREADMAEQIAELVNALGTGCSPFDAFLVLRGVKTLAPRMETHQANAMALAQFLDGHAKVQRVYYPGLTSHRQYDLARKQSSGAGGMVSFDIDVSVDLGAFFDRLELFLLAESLGGPASLIEQVSSMSHASMPEAARVEAGISDQTIRVSVGLEHADDLIADMQRALDA
ncbi:MAG: cystathionine gamma-synthase [Planctomycetaceae bacterium]|nr:cystathionine gamma-synthase [Planctomycetaceae bacterium]